MIITEASAFQSARFFHMASERQLEANRRNARQGEPHALPSSAFRNTVDDPEQLSPTPDCTAQVSDIGIRFVSQNGVGTNEAIGAGGEIHSSAHVSISVINGRQPT
jgi:hypothetical protein